MEQTLHDVEIILVDSGSTDATLSIASRYPTRIVHISPSEFSFGRSLNKGCQAATGEFVVIASGHVYPVYRDWLERLLAPFSDPQVALVYGKQRGNSTTKYSEHQVFAKWFPDESNPAQNHPFCNNANAAIRRSVWEQLPYDESLTGLEDLCWARRAMELGHRIVYAADTEVAHIHDESFGQIYNRYRREAIAMKRIFPQEHFTLANFLRLFPGNTLSDWQHARRDHVLRQNTLAIFLFRLTQFWGTYRGYSQRSPVTQQLRQKFYYPNSATHTRHEVKELEAGRRIEYSGNPTENKVDKRD
jgi:glycosyltransferase involved in cell wall biosynthesis